MVTVFILYQYHPTGRSRKLRPPRDKSSPERRRPGGKSKGWCLCVGTGRHPWRPGIERPRAGRLRIVLSFDGPTLISGGTFGPEASIWAWLSFLAPDVTPRG